MARSKRQAERKSTSGPGSAKPADSRKAEDSPHDVSAANASPADAARLPTHPPHKRPLVLLVTGLVLALWLVALVTMAYWASSG